MKALTLEEALKRQNLIIEKLEEIKTIIESTPFSSFQFEFNIPTQGEEVPTTAGVLFDEAGRNWMTKNLFDDSEITKDHRAAFVLGSNLCSYIAAQIVAGAAMDLLHMSQEQVSTFLQGLKAIPNKGSEEFNRVLALFITLIGVGTSKRYTEGVLALDEAPEAGSEYPTGPCDLPLKCRGCGTVVTGETVVFKHCGHDDCEICQYCSTRRCPNCGAHLCCGGCI